ncbi:SpaA isopeptide-forming pilin-related protein, partial [Patescibacteria group bacterium]
MKFEPTLPGQSWKRKALRGLNIVAQVALVIQMSYLGVIFAAPGTAQAAPTANPAANLDQCRNGNSSSPNDCLDLGGGTGWVNGNAGASQAHYVEGYSIPYRAILTDLPTDGTAVTLTLGYDIKHSGAHAIDYLTSYDRLEPHDGFGHLAESIDPTDGVTGITGGADDTHAIPAPSSASSPVAGQPTNSFNALPGSEKLFSAWNANLTNIAYNTQGDLTAAQAETTIDVTFVPTDSTVLLSWGGHIASRADWGDGNSAGGISGSPYHMRTKDWNIGNLGNQDRSLAAAAVLPAPILEIEKTADPLGATDRDAEILYTITYGNAGIGAAIVDIVDTWSFGSHLLADYVAASATNAYGGVVPVVDTSAKTITWNNVSLPAQTTGLTVTYKLRTHEFHSPEGTYHIFNDASMTRNTEILYANQTDNWVTYECNFELIKSVDPTTAEVGSILTYTLTYDNNGSANCTGGGVTVTDYIPDGTTYVDHSPKTNSNFNGARVVWNIGTVSPGENGILTLQVQVDDNPDIVCGEWEIENFATFWSNQMSGESNHVFTTVGKPCGDLLIIKQDHNQQRMPGVDFTVNGDPYVTDGSGEILLTDLELGDYSVLENVPAGYTLTSVDGLRCTDSNPSTATVIENEVTTCTFTNELDTGTITVYKNVDHDGDGQIDEYGATDWTWDIQSGEQNISTGDSRVLPIGDYTISEDQKAGYHVTDLTCDSQSLGAVESTQLNLAKDQTIECTFTNTRDTGDIKVNKLVDTNGDGQYDGDNTEANNIGFRWGIVPGSNNKLMGSTETVVTGNYDVTENSVPGYHFVGWYADFPGANFSCDEPYGTTLPVNLDVQKDELTEITLCNARDTGGLILQKHVINTYGGNADASDFTMHVKHNSVDVTNSPQAGSESGTLYTLPTGEYTVSESNLPTGYTQVGVVCDGFLTNVVQVEKGVTKTCTIANDDVAPTITLIKEVINDDGGNAQPNDFNLTIGGVPALSGVAYDVLANTPYALDETVLSGYDFVEITGDAKCPAVLGGTVTLDEGESVVCTITNDDQAPSITLIKEVINDNGGNAGINDFGLTIGGTPVNSGDTEYVNANTPVALDEAGLTGYDFVEITGDAKCPDVLGGTATLDEGEHITCTIVNDDQAPSITLIKEVINDNGGNAGINDFGLTIGGTPVNSGDTEYVNANTPVALDEAGLTGYDFVEITGDAKCPDVLGGTATLDEGEHITCTIVNDDIAPKLKLIKHVVNDDGGNAVVADFPLFIDATPATSGQWNTVTANVQYTASETEDPGYEASDWSGDCNAAGEITLQPGDEKVCEITNDDIAPKLKLIKHVVNDD